MKPWHWIVVGVVGFVVLCILALAGAGAYVLVRHVDIQREATPETAEQAFTRIRQRFHGEPPLIDVVGSDPELHRELLATRTPREVDTLHLLVWKPDEKRLIRLHLPFWLLRLARDGSIQLASEDLSNDLAIDMDRIELTVDDLERYGPGLILDHRESDGDRVLLWAQ